MTSVAGQYTYPFKNGIALPPSFSLSTDDSLRATYALHNPESKPVWVVLELFIDEMTVGKIENGGLISVGKAGQLVSRHIAQYKQFENWQRRDNNAVRILLAPKSTAQISVLYRKISLSGRTQYSPRLFAYPAYSAFLNEMYAGERPFEMMTSAFWGLLAIMFLYVLLQFIILRQSMLLYYSGFLLCILLRSLTSLGHMSWMEDIPFLRDLDFLSHFSLTFLFWSLACYSLFVRDFINLTGPSPLMNKVIRLACRFFFAIGIADIFLTYQRMVSPFWAQVYNIITIMMILFAVYSIYILWDRYNSYVKYLFWGVLLFIIMGCAILLNQQFNSGDHTNTFQSEVAIYHLGHVLQILAFSSGLAKRQEIVLTERLALQEQVIFHLEENERKQMELQRIRTDIARDLHDDLGSELSGISILSQVAMKKLDQPEQAETILSTIGETAREVIERMRNIVWSLNIYQQPAYNMAGQIRLITHELLDHTGITFHLKLPDNAETSLLPAEQWRHLSMLYKEALHNVVKHSGATEVIVTVHLTEQMLELTILDNGIGFQVQKNVKSNGLKNQNHRISLLNGQLSIISELQKGTRVEISIPVPHQQPIVKKQTNDPSADTAQVPL